MKEEYKLSHLKELEAESIHIIREVAAEFENPVMLYSIGKDSSVMVRLAEKAFAPGKVPFPLMHIDSKWKFKEMIQFRDEYAKKYGWNLIVESNMEAFNAGVGPFNHVAAQQRERVALRALPLLCERCAPLRPPHRRRTRRTHPHAHCPRIAPTVAAAACGIEDDVCCGHPVAPRAVARAAARALARGHAPAKRRPAPRARAPRVRGRARAQKLLCRAVAAAAAPAAGGRLAEEP